MGLRGAWWLSTDRHASIRWMAPMSKVIRLSKTPSSVLRGVVSNRVFKTLKGSVGREPATGEVRM